MHKEQHNSQIWPTTDMGTIVHLGAGRCSELDDYLAAKPARLLLVEADPQLAKMLQVRSIDHPQVEVINRAVAAQPGPATFCRYNIPDVGSLHRATPGLLELFPGLKMVQELQIEALDPTPLLQPLQLQVEQRNRLIIDLPGEELTVLKALQQADQLHYFEQLQLHCGRESLYEDSEPAAIVIQWLQDQGFDLLMEDDSQDPDRPRWDLKRNKLRLDHRDLKKQLVQKTKIHDEQKALLNERQVQVGKLTKALDEQAQLLAEYKVQFEKVNQAKAANEKLANELQTQVEQLTIAMEEQTKLATEYKTQLEKANQAKAEQVKLSNERQIQIEQLTKARDEQAKLATENKEQLELANQAKAGQVKLANERQAQIEQFTKARDEQAKLTAERKTQLEQANQAKAAQVKLANERHIQIEQLTKARDEQAKFATEYKTQLEKANQAKAELGELANKRQARVEQLTKARDKQEKLAAEQKAQLEKASQDKAEHEKMACERQDEIDQLWQVWDEQAKLASEYKVQIGKMGQAMAQKEKLYIEDLNTAHEELTKKTSEHEQRVVELIKERDSQSKLVLERQELLNQHLNEESGQASKMLDLLKQQKDHLDRMEQGITRHLTKGMENATRQIESFIGIDTYLSRGEMLPSLHGWPVSADFALYVISLIEKNNYDLILEFGSGASTMLMATALLKQMQRRHIRNNQTSENGQPNQQLTDETDFDGSFHPSAKDAREHVLSVPMDLPPRIVSFEHHRDYFEETGEKLRRADLDKLVDLIHAPLRDYVTPNGERFLYYACEETISSLGKMLNGRRANILLLVDGPPASTGKHARYPALPIVLQSLLNHRIDVFLDDYNRQEEKEIVERWSGILIERSIVYEQHVLPFEKGACLLSIK
ncbi:MAG: hypothetical protein JMN24_08060 [gamma proteobacterium endosymbiont of Lamellibrachia anaximandri]|nr:hypothetical protein [gamma proteobacterium endosymbiont of Lamellibrachia anaximandri]MBL3618532.1 hypothetical protein [gamma proteobacterium endosymbiont of Lamellibrachia anaximandri]